jgi:hypothetical protein
MPCFNPLSPIFDVLQGATVFGAERASSGPATNFQGGYPSALSRRAEKVTQIPSLNIPETPTAPSVGDESSHHPLALLYNSFIMTILSAEIKRAMGLRDETMIRVFPFKRSPNRRRLSRFAEELEIHAD